MKRLLCMMLVAAMLISNLPIFAFASEKNVYTNDEEGEVSSQMVKNADCDPETEITPVEKVTVTHINPRYTANAEQFQITQSDETVYLAEDEYCATVAEAGAILRDGMKSRQETITFGLMASHMEEYLFDEIVAAALSHTGVPDEGDYLAWQYAGAGGGYSGYEQDGTYYLTFTVTVAYYTTATEEEQVDLAVTELLNSLSLSGCSDYEKVKGVYDWICANVVYDNEHVNDPSYNHMFTAYGALIDRTCVCQGYAVLLYRLLLELGVDNRVITGTGNGGGHAWNIVELDDVYYNVDSTWDAGRTEYGYFLKSGDDFADHEPNEEYTTEAFTGTYPISDENYVSVIEPEIGIIAEGTCGKISRRVTWVLTTDGTLTISGEGDMKDWTRNNMPIWWLYASEIKRVVIQDGVTSIGSFAFHRCSNLTEVCIPDGVTQIGSHAFYECSAVENVEIPASVEEIDWYAFYGCSALKSIRIPDGVTNIGQRTFSGCANMKEVIIPDSVRTIDAGAFYECASLENITIPADVTWIGSSCFKGCASLKSINIPSGVDEINKDAFSYCTNLVSVSISEGVTTIGDNAFDGCGSLADLVIPDGVISIGISAFNGCSSLTELSIPNSVTSIGNGAFKYCSSLESIVIPEGVSTIDNTTFGYCTGLVAVTLPRGITSIESGAFWGCASLEEIEFPEELSVIESGAFQGCASITSVIFPNSITEIGDRAFKDCSSLVEITFTGEAPSFGQNSFEGVEATCNYPGDSNWTASDRRDYGGNLTWVGGTSGGIPGEGDGGDCANGNHSYESVVTEPTCTEQGYTTHTCVVCGSSYVDDYILAAGHSYIEWIVTGEPTCTENGTEQAECNKCGYCDTREIEATGHHILVSWVSGSCEESSWEIYTCTICDYYDAYEIPARGHEYHSEVSEPTCIWLGYTYYYCSYCGDSYQDNYVDSLGHSFGEWYTVVETTCTEGGMQRRDCERCNDYESDDLAATGHSYTPTVTTPTCTDQGFTTYTCTECGDSYVDDYVEALGHTPGEPVKENEGDHGSHDLVTYCEICGEELSREHDDGYTPGDINGDGEVNNKDLTRLFRYLSGYDVEVAEAALDINGDGEVDNKDLTRLFQYLSDWDVVIN